VRGLPFFNDATYSFDTRASLDIGHGGELGGFAWAVGATHFCQAGNCKRPAVSAAIGSWRPSGFSGQGWKTVGGEEKTSPEGIFITVYDLPTQPGISHRDLLGWLARSGAARKLVLMDF
jgi:hypothetical protein